MKHVAVSAKMKDKNGSVLGCYANGKQPKVNNQKRGCVSQITQ
jgi:hypothetical protein